MDYPFDEVAASANAVIQDGGAVFQKFTCENCGSRQTMDVPDVFYTSGKCEECNHITDLKERGCNYMVVFHEGSRSG